VNRILVPFGFYGAGNIGDEATLAGFARLLQDSPHPASVTVGSRDPRHTARVEPTFRYFHATRRDPRLWYARWRATAVAFAGGTPIQDILGEWPLREILPSIRRAKRARLPLAFVGVGIEDLHLERTRRIVAEELAPLVSHWSVRSAHDAARLRSLGVPADRVTVASDMAWLIDAVGSEAGRAHLARWAVPIDRPLVGVNLVNESYCFEKLPHLARALAASLDALVEEAGAQIVFLANETRSDAEFDSAAAARVAACMSHANRAIVAPAEYLAPQEMMSIIANCALTISMRYHFCLFSVLQRTPFVAIERSAKVRDLCHDIGWDSRVALVDVSPDSIRVPALRLLESAQARPLLESRLPTMRQRAHTNQIALEALVRPGNGPVAGIAYGNTRCARDSRSAWPFTLPSCKVQQVEPRSPRRD